VKEEFEFNKALLMIVETGKSGDDIAHGLSYSINIQNPEYLTGLIKQGFDKQNIPIDYTSDTNPMFAALVNAAISVEAGNISYVYGERSEDGCVKTSSDRVSSHTPSPIITVKR